MGLLIFDKPEKRKIEDVYTEYPDCKFLMRVEQPLDNVGYLLAVCDDPAYDDAYSDVIEHASSVGILHMCGGYKGVDLGVLSEIDKR